MRFTWDPKKAASNQKKHGVSFEEAATVFDDEHAIGEPDAVDPIRTVLVGVSARQRLLVCVYLEIEEEVIRIISARRTTPHERRRYEEYI